MAVLRNSRGIALSAVIGLMGVLLSLIGVGLLFSGLNLKASSNLKTGTGAIHAADAAIQHALQVIPAGQDFDDLLTGTVPEFPCASPCDGTQNKPTLTGAIGAYTYTVVAENDPPEATTPTDDTNKIIVLRATATGPGGSTRRITAYVGRSTAPWRPPGAIFHPGDPSVVGMSEFYGTSFKVSGSDSLPDGAEGSGPEGPVPGIATNNDALTNEIKSLLASIPNQVVGQGTSPSVVNTSSKLDVDKLATDLLNLGVDKQIQNPGNYSAGNWGTASNPKITYVPKSSGVAELRLTGSLTGYGVLITDPNIDLHIGGNFKWYGLIIARRHPHLDPTHFGEQASNGGTVYGAVLINNSPLAMTNMGGVSKVYYSSQAIQNYVLSRWASVFPLPPKILAWSEQMN